MKPVVIKQLLLCTLFQMKEYLRLNFLVVGMGIETGADLSSLLRTGHYICSKLKKSSNSKVAKALPIKETKTALESYANVRKGSLCV